MFPPAEYIHVYMYYSIWLSNHMNILQQIVPEACACQEEWPTLILTAFNSFHIKRTYKYINNLLSVYFVGSSRRCHPFYVNYKNAIHSFTFEQSLTDTLIDGETHKEVHKIKTLVK